METTSISLTTAGIKNRFKKIDIQSYATNSLTTYPFGFNLNVSAPCKLKNFIKLTINITRNKERIKGGNNLFNLPKTKDVLQTFNSFLVSCNINSQFNKVF